MKTATAVWWTEGKRQQIIHPLQGILAAMEWRQLNFDRRLEQMRQPSYSTESSLSSLCNLGVSIPGQKATNRPSIGRNGIYISQISYSFNVYLPPLSMFWCDCVFEWVKFVSVCGHVWVMPEEEEAGLWWNGMEATGLCAYVIVCLSESSTCLCVVMSESCIYVKRRSWAVMEWRQLDFGFWSTFGANELQYWKGSRAIQHKAQCPLPVILGFQFQVLFLVLFSTLFPQKPYNS